MGHMIDGTWHVDEQLARLELGRFQRPPSTFRRRVTADGREDGYAAEAGRYHLYVSLACPWAHRTLIMRALKGLESMITVSVVHWAMLDQGWTFEPGPGVVPDPIHGARALHDVYRHADPHYTGRVTVPVLWDRHTGTIVNNESAEILRMLNGAFDTRGARAGDYYPAALRPEIDAVNDRIYHTLNNGVYRCGFAATQDAYDEAVAQLFDTLDWLEGRLARQRYLAGDVLTEADIRLYPTLARFDLVYHSHFKCMRQRLVEFPNLWGYTRDLYQQSAFRTTTDFEHIRRHYYFSQRKVNPLGIVPVAYRVDFDAPHDRARRFG
ncbi:MAG: glutathione S-transferase family protein [Gammaproteobacteria bacterium]